jgi:argininosuccinate lyase
VTAPGRLTTTLGARTIRVVYGEPSAAETQAELAMIVRVDRAHVVMLAGQNLITRDSARQLLGLMQELSGAGFEGLIGRPAPRGLYLMYEGYLIDRLGAGVGGVLHLGRSRNDLNATIAALRLRDRTASIIEQAGRMLAVLLARARAYQAVVMPVYTHYQAAMPMTYGYYLLGVASAVSRELDALRAAAGGLTACPLGAAAAAGTELPIAPAATAALLGFDRPAAHALDAVASRDAALRLMAAGASLTVLLSRLAADFQLWSTREFGLIAFPDRLAGGSSAMPQKRNAFLLEHVKARAGAAIGAWTAAASDMRSTPFANSIEAGTEAVAQIGRGLAAVEDATLLGQVLASGARPVPDTMRARAEAGYITATTLANRLAGQGMSFREAHTMVGDAVRKAVAAGSTDLAAFGPPGWLDSVEPVGDLAQVVRAQRYGGGPGDFAEPYRQVCAAWNEHRRWLGERRQGWRNAESSLAGSVAALLRTGGAM